MEEVTVVLEQDLQAVRLIIPDRTEQRCAAIFICAFDQVLINAKLAKDLRHLVMAIGDGLVESVAASLVLNAYITSHCQVELNESYIAKHRRLQDVGFRVGLYFLSLPRCFVLIVGLACVVLFLLPVLQEANLFLVRVGVEVSRELPLECICARDVKEKETFFCCLSLPFQNLP